MKNWNKKFGNFIYVKLYNEKDKVSNTLLVIGFLRSIYGFKNFFYLELKKK